MAEILCPLCNKIVTFDNICKCIFSKNCKNTYFLPKLKDFDKKNSKNDELIEDFNDNCINKTWKLCTDIQQNYNEEFETLIDRKYEDKKLNYIFCGNTKHRKFCYLSEKKSNDDQLKKQCNISYSSKKIHFYKNKVYPDVVPILRSSENVELGCKFGNGSNSNHKSEPISTEISCKQSLFETSAFISTDKLSSEKGEMSCIKSKTFSFSIDKILSKTLPNVVSEKNGLDPEKNIPGTPNFSFNPNISTAINESHEEACEMSIIHYGIHTNEKPFVCDLCKKAFTNQSNLNQHYIIHTHEKSFVCKKCGKRFKRKSHLVGHERTHTGEKPYKCNVCEKRFNHKYQVAYHHRTHSGEKPYECNVCGKRFNYKHHLVDHHRTHTGEKPYECGICRKRFSQRSSLNTHTRTHSNENLFQCELCQRRFKNESCFMFHRRQHTAEKP